MQHLAIVMRCRLSSVTCMYCGQTVRRIKMKLGMQVGLGPGYIVLDGNPAPPPLFSAHICCDQMAAWINMSLGMEQGLGPGDFVLDGDPAPPSPKGAEPPDFRPMYIVATRLHGSYASWYADRPYPKWHCIRWGPKSTHPKGHSSPPQFFLHLIQCHLGRKNWGGLLCPFGWVKLGPHLIQCHLG